MQCKLGSKSQPCHLLAMKPFCFSFLLYKVEIITVPVTVGLLWKFYEWIHVKLHHTILHSVSAQGHHRSLFFHVDHGRPTSLLRGSSSYSCCLSQRNSEWLWLFTIWRIRGEILHEYEKCEIEFERNWLKKVKTLENFGIRRHCCKI